MPRTRASTNGDSEDGDVPPTPTRRRTRSMSQDPAGATTDSTPQPTPLRSARKRRGSLDSVSESQPVVPKSAAKTPKRSTRARKQSTDSQAEEVPGVLASPHSSTSQTHSLTHPHIHTHIHDMWTGSLILGDDRSFPFQPSFDFFESQHHHQRQPRPHQQSRRAKMCRRLHRPRPLASAANASPHRPPLKQPRKSLGQVR